MSRGWNRQNTGRCRSRITVAVRDGRHTSRISGRMTTTLRCVGVDHHEGRHHWRNREWDDA